MDQEHQSMEIDEQQYVIDTLTAYLQDAQKALDTLIYRKRYIEEFVLVHKITDDEITEKLNQLSDKIKELTEQIKKFKNAITACSNNIEPLYQYFSEHVNELNN